MHRPNGGNAARQLTKLFFGILAAFKESMTLHLAHTQTDRRTDNLVWQYRALRKLGVAIPRAL